MIVEDYITDEEIKKFEEEEIPKDLAKEAYDSVNESFVQMKFKKAMDEFSKTLAKDEYIIDHISGSAVDAKCERAIMSVAGPGCYLSNPMFFEWPFFITLVKTNQGFYGVERAMYGNFIRSFKLKKENMKIFVDNRVLLQAEKEDGKVYNLDFYLEKLDRLKEVLRDEKDEKVGLKKKTRWEKDVDKIFIIQMIFTILLTIFIVYQNLSMR
ncbi:MAG: hypothetical protein ACRDCB_14085 [Clostridium sp.]|uniref:hypothetical protein n=1 Tax=Clostridium TaxID=1485 RepID=UPI002153361A|nr:hypothetical protein [Clostridium sp. LY3-2]MCR6514562.1 hypothetical protein [Clostridium sp. LY3-2]